MVDKEPREKKKTTLNLLFVNYIIFGIIFTFVIGVFSLIMSGIAHYRNGISLENFDATQEIYYGPLEQSSPSLREIDKTGDLYKQNNLTIELIKKYIDNTFLTSTDGKVIINAEFVKKGLEYLPTYRTEFTATYILANKLDEKSFVSFEFPFPFNSSNSEISNAKLIVNGVLIDDAKQTINFVDQYGYASQSDGLRWEGEIGANAEIAINVSYNTVGLSRFSYQGIENSKQAQDFKFSVTVNGTRSYDVLNGLSVDKKEFGSNNVTLNWDKKDLYNKPVINVSVGGKLNPSTQVSRIYLTMVPIYIVFIAIVLFLSYKFGKTMGIFDMFLVTILFTVFFPFVHYLSSFTVDPTIELFSNLQVGEYSMPLYLAFGIAWVIIGGLIYYLVGRLSGFRFSTRFIIPLIILFLGFFPLVVTVPEYSMLLVIIGAIALLAIVVQTRIKLMKV